MVKKKRKWSWIFDGESERWVEFRRMNQGLKRSREWLLHLRSEGVIGKRI